MKVFDGCIASTAYTGARSCPYCAQFSEDGHSSGCPWRRLIDALELASENLQTEYGPYTENDRVERVVMTALASVGSKRGIDGLAYLDETGRGKA